MTHHSTWGRSACSNCLWRRRKAIAGCSSSSQLAVISSAFVCILDQSELTGRIDTASDVSSNSLGLLMIEETGVDWGGQSANR